MTYHPYTPATLCNTCGLAENQNTDHIPVGVPEKTRSYWVHWNSVVKNDTAGKALVQREAVRRSYLLINQWDAWMISVAKAVNPSIKVFVYKDASSTRSYDSSPVTNQPCGVRYSDAPDAWFAKDSSGKRIQYSGYSGHWLMDVSNVDYRKAWASNVKAAIVAGGFDGVFIDNLLWARNAYGVIPRNYASDAVMQDAYVGFLSTVRVDMQSAGKLMLGNLSNARLVAGRWSKYLDKLDGAWDEWWLTISDIDLLPEYAEGWTRVVGEIVLCEQAGKIALVQPHFTAGSVKPFRYSYASYLMAANGKAAFAEANKTDGYGLPTSWHVEFDWDLGTPVGVYRTLAPGGLYCREFTQGIVLVNANKTTSAPISLGSTFWNENGLSVSSVTLAATSGTILRKVR